MGGFFQQKVLLSLRCGELLVGLEETVRDAMQTAHTEIAPMLKEPF